MRRTAAITVFASLLLSTSAYASGYGLRDTSASTLGLSYAGNAANGTQASTLSFNPALLADVDTFDISFSNVGLLPQTSGHFTATTSAHTAMAGNNYPVDIVNTALIPSFSLRYRISSQFTAGLTLTAPWGMITDYGNDSLTRYYNTVSDVKTFNATPMVAWQPIPELSIGAGVQIQYLKGRLGKAIDFGTIGYSYGIPGSVPGARDGFVELKGQDWAEGWMVGVEWKPSAKLSLGLSYRSKIDNTMKAKEVFTLDSAGIGATLRAVTGAFVDGPATAKMTNPSIVTFGARWQVDDRWTLLAGGDWTSWSNFGSLVAHSSNIHQPDDVSMMSWQDSWFTSVGAEYKAADDWTLKAGVAYDQTPTTSGRRTPGIPDASRFWISAGVAYKLNQHMDLDLSVARLTAQRANIALSQTDTGNTLRGNLNGYVNLRVTLIGLELAYHL